MVVLGGTIGSIVGPPLLQIIERFASSNKLPAMSLPWFVMSVFLAASFVMVFVFLRPDPVEISRVIAENKKAVPEGSEPGKRPLSGIMKDGRFFPAICSIVCGHLVMYLVMTVTPVYMNECHHQISSISWVIFFHVLGMYGFSFFIGYLIDRAGRTTMIITGSLFLVSSCILAPFSSSVAWLAFILFLVGLGWNCCFVTGSTLLSDILMPGERGSVQGMVDTFVNITAGVSSLGSGLLFASLGFSIMSWVALFVAILPVILILVMFLLKRKTL